VVESKCHESFGVANRVAGQGLSFKKAQTLPTASKFIFSNNEPQWHSMGASILLCWKRCDKLNIHVKEILCIEKR